MSVLTYIFLDIDGVLSLDRFNFNKDCLDNFENAVRVSGRVRIVISSSWKNAYTLEHLKGRFSPDVQTIIVGVTPDYENFDPVPARHQEVLLWLEKEGLEDANWIGIDDNPLEYEDSAPVIWIDRDTGFTYEDGRELVTELHKLRGEKV